MNRPIIASSRADVGAVILRRLLPAFLVITLGLGVAFVSDLLIGRLGLKMFAFALGGVVGLAVLAWLSMKSLTIVMLAWILVMGGIRRLVVVHMPGLPDFSLDRAFLVWIILVFILQSIRTRQRFQGPYWADVLIFLHTLYVMIQLQVLESIHFHAWVMSGLSPFFAYVYGKNIVKSERDLRHVMLFMLVMSVYFFVQSIAEQYKWYALIWPKLILDPEEGFWSPGRSRGPFCHAPLFGQVSSMFLFVYFLFLVKTKRIGVQVALAVGLALSALGLFYTYTRGPWLATAMGVVTLAFLRRSYRRILLVVAFVASIGGILGISRLANKEFLQERIESVNTVENRLMFFATATRMIKDHALFGVGFFRYNDYRDFYNRTTDIPFYGMVRKHLGEGMVIHDIYLGRLAEEGLIGLGLMVAFWVVITRAFFGQWRANPRGPWFNRDMLAVFAAMMVSYMVGGLVIDFRYFDMVNVIFCLLAGIIYGYRSQYPATS